MAVPVRLRLRDLRRPPLTSDLLARIRARGGLTAVALLALALLIGLGVWQLERRAWKEDLLARVAAARTAPPEALGSLLARSGAQGSLEFRNAVADCPGLATARFVQLYAIAGGQPGWRLISACPLDSGRYDAVLVDRGFINADQPAQPAVAQTTEIVRVTGPLRLAETAGPFTPPHRNDRWFSRDIAGMGAELGVERPAPVILTSSAPVPAGAGLIAAPLPTEIANRHLEYALTWFALAAVLAGVWAALILRSRAPG